MEMPGRHYWQRLQAATPRERAGMAAVLALAMVAGAVLAFDGVIEAQQRAEEAAERLVVAETRRTLETEVGYRDAVGVATGNVWHWSIVQESEGVARAEAVSRVEALASEAGLGDASIELEDARAGDTPGLVTPIFLTMTASFDWGSFGVLLEALRSSDLSLIVESVQIERSEDASPQMTLRLRLPFLHDAEAP